VIAIKPGKKLWPVRFRVFNRIGRVEMWRGGSRLGIAVVRPFRLAVPQ
jgi:hypothetical protein